VRPTAIIVAREFFDDPPEVALVDRDEVVKALPADGADQPFAESVGCGRSRRSFQDANPEAVQCGVEARRKDPVTVMDKKAVWMEVASVKLTPSGSFGYTSWSPYGRNRYGASNATLHFLIQLAYGIPLDQISGIEKLGSEHYEISAKAEDGVLLALDQLQPRLQRLLVERFKLATHRDQKEYDGYALVVARGGPRLKSTAGVSENGMIYPGGSGL
jgi:hypothetical protein